MKKGHKSMNKKEGMFLAEALVSLLITSVILAVTMPAMTVHKKQAGAPPSLPDIIPADAIMAFNLSSCPSGWTRFSVADGRFLVGIGNNTEHTYFLGDSGGKDAVRLQGGELPEHSHTHFFSEIDSAGTVLDIVYGPSLGDKSPVETDNTGGHDAHENRPRYRAVLWCRKT